ncbi:MAG: hypothetical protein A2Z91_02355 [Deltaproteobacteria bacterium GWA2_38_16]|nr:MAG: hypothetical protein A2Z91_02355 [Deltaproteobacteria bacterium GWA2_38_16]OGQ02038.1 MAG: hypothetical protein A3D19_08650 [Deltaproteobacteria bacterium RIFCSPHIGHO2_02_FULL_38_15]HBQ21572.1 hypothetical protein [Deltaproteobacteria bacterium]
MAAETLPPEEFLRNDIFFTAQRIEMVSQKLIYIHEQMRPKEKTLGATELPGLKEGRFCTNCHEERPTGPLQLPEFITNPNFLIPKSPAPHKTHETPKETFAHLQQDILDLKIRTEQYLTSNAALPLHITMIKVYLAALTQYLVVSLLMDPFGNPFDLLDIQFGLRFSPERIQEIKNYISDSNTEKTTKDIFSVLTHFEDNALIFSDTFKMNIELSSYLKAQNEEAWLNILKLQTTKYLASQLLHITDYWPEVGYKNKEFFGKLSRYFRSMDHHFGSMIAEKEREKQSEFNYFLLEYISSKPIPTVITLERYRDLISYAPRMAEALGDHLENYLTQSRFIETEQQFTLKELKKVFKNYPYSLLDRRSKELAQWIREKILEIKKQFFHSHLLYHFVQEREIDESKIPELEEKYLKQFSQELSLDLIQTWVINFHSPNSSLKASAKFLKLTLLDVPSMVELIQEIDDQIQALLLYDFNKSVSWSYDVLEGRPERAYMRGKGLADRWYYSGMDNEEMKSMIPVPLDPSVPDLLPPEYLPTIKPIENNQINFGILLSQLIAPLSSNVFLLKNIEKFSQAKTKEDLLNTYETLLTDLEIKVNIPRPEIGGGHTIVDPLNMPMPVYISHPQEQSSRHEKEELETALKHLQKLGEKLKNVNSKNTDTLDDFFNSNKEKVEFLKTKRNTFINLFRILSVPLEDKLFLHHIQDLQKQDGITKEDIETFLAESEKYAAQFPDFIQSSHYSFLKFKEAYQKKIQEFLKAEEADEMIAYNRAILTELRKLKDALWYFKGGYDHPEYFINVKGELLSERTLTQLKKVKSLRERRKEIYLDKGGAILDQWMKSYVMALMTREALMTQDALIRKNIHKVISAKNISDIKEFVLDPFILDQALKMVSEEHPDQVWRITSYRKMHMNLINEYSHTLLDSYFHGSIHSVAFWSLLTISIILAFVPGGQIPSYFIGVLLLSDFAVQCGHDLYNSFIVLPESLQKKKDFFLSQAEAGAGAGDYGEFEKLEEGIFWQKTIAVGGTALFFIPWARSEVKRGMRLFFTDTMAIKNALLTLRFSADTTPALAEIRQRTNHLLEQNTFRSGLPTITPEFEELLIRDRANIEEALKILEKKAH